MRHLILFVALALRHFPASQHRKNPIYLSISQVLEKCAPESVSERGSRRCAQEPACVRGEECCGVDLADSGLER